MADIDCGHLTISQHEDALARLVATLGRWGRRMREREQLARLTELELRDIGVAPAQARVEANKPFWRA